MNQYYTFNEYLKDNELTPSEEDYLEMIYRLHLGSKQVKVAQLAHSLNVKNPSASKMVKRLQSKNLLNHENYGNLILTDKGMNTGYALLIRHHTVESFLKIIGLENNLHNETEKIEHTINDQTLGHILTLVNFFNDNPDVLALYTKYCNK